MKSMHRVIIGIAVVLGVGGTAALLTLQPGALSFAGGHSVALSDYKGPTPVGVPAELRSADLVTRGKYLTQAADCQVCHTRDGGQPFAGGRAFKTPFGVLYSPNITADRETGIGTWTDADFLRAVHEGIAKSGERLYPAFPYESYSLISDDDVQAIKVYLFSLPVAHAAAPPNSLRFPFNQRWLMAIWSGFYNPNRRFRPHEDRSPQWNRGAYLAEALGHCGDCHTGRNLTQALDNRHKFGGAVIAGWRAYNITPDRVSGVGGWSDAELAQYLHTGYALGHGPAAGPMAEEVDVSSSALVPTDVRAMIAYLRSVPPIHTPDLSTPKPDSAADFPAPPQVNAEPLGREVFEGACASCHGWSGVSLLTPFATLTGDRAVNDPSAINVAQVVLAGEHRRTAEGVVLMPSFGHAYSDSEIAAVANYVTGRFGVAASQLSARDVARYRELSAE